MWLTPSPRLMTITTHEWRYRSIWWCLVGFQQCGSVQVSSTSSIAGTLSSDCKCTAQVCLNYATLHMFKTNNHLCIVFPDCCVCVCVGLTDDVTELRIENAALGRQFCLVHERLEEAVLALSGLQRQVSRLEHQQGTGSGGGTGPSSVEELSPHARSFTLPSSR